ncbi:hypothetical protein, partial [Rhizobium sp.]|uniref:hypothetical protein n=1 Tax=Rhizobium sp. TaxID=391 RepID=UPI0028AE3DC4
SEAGLLISYAALSRTQSGIAFECRVLMFGSDHALDRLVRWSAGSKTCLQLNLSFSVAYGLNAAPRRQTNGQNIEYLTCFRKRGIAWFAGEQSET